MIKRILLVDDELYVRKVSAFALKKEGYEVVTAQNGDEGLRKAKALTLDLILMDLKMPDMDGFEACKRIRSEDSCKDVPIMVVTAHANKKMVAELVEIGISDYIIKPFDLKVLLYKIKKLLGEDISMYAEEDLEED